MLACHCLLQQLAVSLDLLQQVVPASFFDQAQQDEARLCVEEFLQVSGGELAELVAKEVNSFVGEEQDLLQDLVCVGVGHQAFGELLGLDCSLCVFEEKSGDFGDERNVFLFEMI